MKSKRNNYVQMKVKLLIRVIKQRKISVRKIFNVFKCSLAYWTSWKEGAVTPYILSIELWNECNIKCMFCRDKKGVIHDVNPKGKGIAKGKMSKEMAKEIIGQLKDDVLITVLYTNGEPLLYPDLAEVIKSATDCGMATLISSNGLLFTEEKIHEVLGAGLDFIKIQLGGFTQDIYSVQISNGDVEKLKENIQMLSRINNEFNYGCQIMIDYISYNYNKHQFPFVKEFCNDLGLQVSRRPGNPSHGLEKTEKPQNVEELPLKMKCDYLWKVMQVNFNGDILPCCDAVVWSGLKPYDTFKVGETDVKKVWRSDSAMKMRETMATKGRGALDICSQCTRKGVCFKW